MLHKKPEQVSQKIISRDKEIETILHQLFPGIIVFLVGKMGAGKTSIMHSIVQREPDRFYWFNGSIYAHNPIDHLMKKIETFPQEKIVLFDEAIAILLTIGDPLGVLQILVDKGTLLSVTPSGLSKFLITHPKFFIQHTKRLVYLSNGNLRKPGGNLGSINSL